MTEKTPCALNKRMVFLHDVSLGGVRGLLALAADLSPCGQFREAGGEIAQSGGDVYVLGAGSGALAAADTGLGTLCLGQSVGAHDNVHAAGVL